MSLKKHTQEKKRKKSILKTSVVVQWLRIYLPEKKRICLPVQETQVLSLVWEYSTCHGAAKLVGHTYCFCMPQLQLLKPTYPLQLLKPIYPRGHALQQEKAPTMRSPWTAKESSPRSPQLEKAQAATKTGTAKDKIINSFF